MEPEPHDQQWETDMLWQAIVEPQRHAPRGETGTPSSGWPAGATASREPNLHRWQA